ncbi:unnamed protein product [Rhizophagus irregularis]|nr:unnamed protein product [Rhizophagus irregularis]
MYLFLTGDSSALSNWPYADNPNAIEEDNNRVSYLMQKAEILAEIELFYLLPHQRRWQTWFPEVIHYYADVDKTRIEIKRLIKDEKEIRGISINLQKLLKSEPYHDQV